MVQRGSTPRRGTRDPRKGLLERGKTVAAPTTRKGPKVTTRVRGAKPSGDDVRGKLRAYYKRVKSLAIATANSEQERKEVQKEAVAFAKDHGLSDEPITFTMDGNVYRATITSPEASPTWDVEKIVEYLHRTKRWDACSSRVFDQKKFEAEITAGNIPQSVARKFQVPGTPSTPYCNIRKV